MCNADQKNSIFQWECCALKKSTVEVWTICQSERNLISVLFLLSDCKKVWLQFSIINFQILDWFFVKYISVIKLYKVLFVNYISILKLRCIYWCRCAWSYSCLKGKPLCIRFLVALWQVINSVVVNARLFYSDNHCVVRRLDTNMLLF